MPWVESWRNYWFVRTATAHDAMAWSTAWSSEHLADNAARALGDIHEAGKDLWATGEQEQFFNVDRLDPYHWSVRDVLHGFDVVLERLNRRSLSAAEGDAVATVAKELRADPPYASLGPVGLTHQDFRPENLLVSDGRVLEVVDWDRARPDHQLYDAVLAGILISSHGRSPGQDEIKRARRFVETYLSVHPLPVDQDAVDWMFRFVAVKNICLSRSPRKWVSVLQSHGTSMAGAHVVQPVVGVREPAPTIAG